MRLVWATVVAVTRSDRSIQSLDVALDTGERARAIAYPQLTGECAAQDRVQINTTAVDLGLGTGGSHFVTCRLGDARGVSLDAPSGGHIMKLRYTPLQMDVVSVESPESKHHAVMREVEALDGMPVVCCGLHSQVPLVAAAVKHEDPAARVVYCMTDGAALPAALSDLARDAMQAGLIDATITCGQAFGGTLEAVNLHSGLLAARHVLGADIAIVAVGPGIVGSATPLGHGGVAQGEAVNAVAALDGVAVVCLRISLADERERHHGLSHHTTTALAKIALAPAIVALPALAEQDLNPIRSTIEGAGIDRRHRVVVADSSELEPPSLRGLEVTTMGRTRHDDPAFFAAAFAAGSIAFRVASGVLET